MLRVLKYSGIGLLSVMLVAVLAVTVSEVHSFDVFWQLQSGKYIWETKSFIRNDTFTLMQDLPRAEHTWLHSLSLYFIYLLGGYNAISVLKGLVVSVTLLALIWTARCRQASLVSIALIVPIFMLTSGGWLERPQIWTFLLFALFVWRLELFSEDSSWKVLWLLPLALFWINVHGGSVLAMAVMAACLVGNVIDSLVQQRSLPNRNFWKILVPVTLIPLFGALATPYPSHWFTALFSAHKIGASVDAKGKVSGSATAVFNMDWTPTTFQQEPLFFYAMGGVALLMLLGWRKLRFRDLCLMAGLAIMGMKLVRHIPFFYMGMVAICPVYVDAAVKPIQRRMSDAYQQVAALLALMIAAALFLWLYQPAYKIYGSFNTGLREWHYPIEATEFVKEHRLAKNLYNTYDWGGYMAWQLYPDYLVFWDGRQTSADMFQQGWNVMAGKPDWEEILNRFEVKTIVSRAATIDTGQKYPLLDRLAKHPEWFLVFNSESSLVFVKRGSVPDRWLKTYARPKEMIDETVLSEALLMVNVNPNRYMAWWSLAEVYTRKKEFRNALFAVNQHLARAPRKHPAAESLRAQLLQVVKTQSR